MRRKVMITGVGPVCGLGQGPEAFWDGLAEGRSSLSPITAIDASGFDQKLAGEVDGLDARKHVPKSYRKATKVMARDTELAVVSASLAMQDAGLTGRGNPEDEGTPINQTRTGCHIGAGLISAEADEIARALVTSQAEDGGLDCVAWGAGEGGGGGMNSLPPLWLLKYLPNMLACHVTIVHGAEGPSNTLTCAESSGLLCAGESSRVIERDNADMCFTGGAESKVNPMGMLRLALSGRLGPTGDATDGADVLRPYDAGSSAGVLGEAGSILILEEAEHVKSRGGKVYAELAGFGAAQSPIAAIDPTTMPSTDHGLVRAIHAALQDAGCSVDDIDAVFPGAVGVPSLDAAELSAFREVFGDRLAEVPLVPITPNVGNCAAGLGGLVLTAAAMSVERQQLPARIHRGEPVAGIDVGPSDVRDARLGVVVACLTGMAGQAAAVVLRRVAS